MSEKKVIYQLLPRLFTNYNGHCVPSGTIEQNGAGKLNDITPRILREIKKLGVTHVWYTGVIEHSHRPDYSAHGIRRNNPHVVKGQAGSPYAITDYYDIDPDLAVDVDRRMEEFESLVERTHAEGMEVIIDFVPNHVAREYHSDNTPAGVDNLGAHDDKTKYFAPSNNFYYIPRQLFAPAVDMGDGSDAYVEFPAKVSGNDCFTAFPGQYDWYDTIKLNYGVDYGNGSHHFDPIPDTWLKMLNILRFWAAKGIDGFRCDMVHMVPLEFWEWAIPAVKEHYPDITFIAEIYDPALYRDFIHRGGFDYLYDKVSLYDTLRGVLCSNISAARITNCWQTVEGINGHMLNFLENHDEQRFGSRQFAGDPSKVTPLLVVSSMINTGPVMIYAGQELGEQAVDAEGYSGLDGRTTIFDYWSVPTLRRWLNGGKADGAALTERELWLRGRYAHILNLLHTSPAITEGGFFDLMYVNYDNPTVNPHRQYFFLRSCPKETLVIAVNFSDRQCSPEINIPQHAFDILGLPTGSFVATELLSGDKMNKELHPLHPFTTTIDAYGAAVWSIKHRKGIGPRKKTSEKTAKKTKKA